MTIRSITATAAALFLVTATASYASTVAGGGNDRFVRLSPEASVADPAKADASFVLASGRDNSTDGSHDSKGKDDGRRHDGKHRDGHDRHDDRKHG